MCFQGEGDRLKVERAVILCYNYARKSVSHMCWQVHSNDLRVMNGFDIQGIARQFTYIACQIE